MNLLKAQDLLKGVPDQALQQMLQSPPGNIPPFLIASEAARRAKLRQEYQGDMQGKAPTSTVVEDLMNNLGVAALKPPGEQQVPVQAPQMPAAPQEPVQMYDGGIVAFANGGPTDMYQFMPEYARDIQIEELPGFEEFMGQAQTAMGSSELPKYREEIEAERARMAKEEPSDISSTLKYIGRGLAQSKSRDFMSSLAQGISAGLDMQEQAQLKSRESQRQLRASEIELAQKERAERAGLFGLAKQLEASALQKRNNAINQSYQASQLALTGRHYQDVASDAAERRGIDLKRLGLEAQRVGLEGQRARQGEAAAGLERQIKELTLKRLQTGELDPSDKSRVLVALSKAKSELVGALSLDPKYNKDIESIKKKYPDPLIQQRAIQQYMRQYYDSAGISELEALLNPTPIK